MQYQVIESKLNHMSLEELELCDPNTFGVVINKLLHISLLPYKAQTNAVIDIAKKMALIDSDRPVNGKEVSPISYNKYKGRWLAIRFVKGEKVEIKSSYSKEVLEDAYIDYCIINNLPL